MTPPTGVVTPPPMLNDSGLSCAADGDDTTIFPAISVHQSSASWLLQSFHGRAQVQPGLILTIGRLRGAGSSRRGTMGMDLREVLDGAVVMAPMTKGSNLPYRRLCAELGARVLMSEMTVARRLKQKRRSEFALIRRAPDEPFFGVQLAGTNPEEMGWAAALVESRGADLVDVNFGCPIDYFTRKGLGATLGRQPKRIQRIIEGMKQAVTGIPVTAKIRLGWSEDARNYLDQAKAAADGGADAIFVHGRTRNARYRQAADWDAIGEVVAAVPVPVVGNGDILFPHDIEAAPRSGCAGVMAGRGVLIKPWLFREATGATGTSARTSGSASTGATSTSRASTGAGTTTAWRGSASSCAGTSGSGAATRRGAPTAPGPACRPASR